MHYRQGVFSGWVRQPSPCCGAASLAGAFNALLGLHRNDSKALTHISVLTVYRTMFTALLEKKILSFSRKLGAPFETILTQLELYIEKEGKCVGKTLYA